MFKKSLPFSFLLLSFFYYTNAQYCGGSGPTVCTAPSALPMVGFYPPADSLPCATIGVPFDQTVSFLAPPTVTQGGTTYTLNYIQVDTLSNLPCGMCWRMGTANNQILGNGTGCVRVTGTTYDAPGQFKSHVIVTANVQFGPFPINVGNQNAETLGVKYYIRVAGTDGTCPYVDTLAVGNTASPSGTLAAPAINGSSNICSGGNTTLTVPGSAYYAYKWSNGAATASTSVSAAGTYTVTVYGNCTSATASKTITVTTVSPTITPSGATTFCSGGSVTLDAGSGYTSYAWSNSSTASSINVTQGGTYTVTVTQSGCTATASQSVTVNSTTASITASGPTTFCSGGSVSLDAGSGYTSYAWSNGSASSSINATQSGTYTVTVSQNSCTATASQSVTVNSTTASITASGPTTFCSGGSVSLDAGSGYTSYAWSNSATSSSINATQSGTYTVTVSQNSCTATASQSVTVNNTTVSITASGPTTFCSGGSVSLDAGNGYASYAWSNGSSSSFINATQGGTYTVTVSQNSCTATASQSVTVTNTTVSITPSGPLTFCAGGNVSLDAGSGYASYTWSNGETSAAITVDSSATYTVTVTKNGCSATDSKTVSVTSNNLSPVITYTPSLNICAGGSTTLDAGSGYTAYAWSTGDNSQTISATSQASYSVTVTQGTCSGADTVAVVVGNFPVAVSVSPSGPVNGCAGDVISLDAGAGYDSFAWSSGESSQSISVTTGDTYIVTVTQNSCVGYDTVVVNMNPIPSVSITPSGLQSICAGQSVTFHAGSGFDTYTWSNGSNTDTNTVIASGIYYVTVSQNGCSASDSASVAVSNNNINLAITPAGPVTICPGAAATFDAGNGYDTYVWSSAETTQTISPSAAATYEVTVTQGPCSATASVQLNVVNAPVAVSISPSGTVTACDGDEVMLDAGNGYDTYSWSTGDMSQNISVTAAGSYIVSVEQNFCTGTDTVEVILNSLPVAGISQVSSQGNIAVLEATPAGASYEWLFQDSPTGAYTIGSSVSQTDSVACGDVIEYHTVVVTLNGCSDTSAQLAVVCAGISDISSEVMKVSLHPNPAKEVLHIHYELNESSRLRIFLNDLTGRKVMEVYNGKAEKGIHQQAVNLSELSQGIYLIHFVSENGEFNSKFVKE